MEIEHIFDIIGSRLECKKMAEAQAEWELIENSKDHFVPAVYTYQYVRYQNEYLREHCMELHNLSIVLYNVKTPIGIWPLIVMQKNGVWEITSGDQALYPPVISNTVNIKKKRKIYTKCFEICEKICRELEISQWISKDMEIGKEGISVWTRMLLERDYYCQWLHTEAYVDLSREEQKIFSSFRKSYKSCITKGEHLWSPRIIHKNCDKSDIESCFENFEKLHIEVAGRRTRNHQTWMLQCDAVKETNDFAVFLYDKAQELAGASLYHTSGTLGYYSVGAYKRSLFEEFPLAHVSQWEAIKYMKQLGLQWYHIGTRFYQSDWNHPTEKEISIAHFKEGFATHFFPSFYITVNIKEGS